MSRPNIAARSKPANVVQRGNMRKLFDIAYGTTLKTEKISLGMLIRQLYLVLTFKLTLTDTNNTLAKTLRGDAWAAVRSLRLKAGSRLIRDLSGEQNWWFESFLWHRFMPSALTLGDGTANPTVSVAMPISFATGPFNAVGAEWALDTRALSDLRLEVEWNPSTSINADAASYDTAPNLAVYVEEAVPNPTMKYIHSDVDVTKVVAVSSGRNEIDLPTAAGAYHCFLFNTQNSSNVDAASIVSNYQFRTGNKVWTEFPEEVIDLRSGLRMNGFNVNRALSSGKGGLNQPLQSAKSALAGWKLWRPSWDGRASEDLDTMGLAELKLIATGLATGTLNVITQRIVG